MATTQKVTTNEQYNFSVRIYKYPLTKMFWNMNWENIFKFFSNPLEMFF